MMKSTGPIDCNITFLPIESRSAFHASTSANAAEFEKAVEYRTVITDIEAALLFLISFHVVGGDFLEEIDVFIGMKLGHFVVGGGFRTLPAHQLQGEYHDRASM